MHKIVSLHKYYLWATHMAAAYQREFPNIQNRKLTSWAHPDALHTFMFMSYWFATLYAVVEGWQEMRLTDPVIDPLLTAPHLDLLRRYRNGVFHFQADYFDRRYSDLTTHGEAIAWVNKLHGGFTAYFTRWFETHDLDGTLK
jgi:hypothetical protein